MRIPPRLFRIALALVAPAGAAILLLLTVGEATVGSALSALAAASVVGAAAARILIRSFGDPLPRPTEEPGARQQAREAAFELLHDPLILLDCDRSVMGVNRAARGLLGDDILGRDLVAGLRHPALLEATEAVLAGAPERVVEFNLSGPAERVFLARATRFRFDSDGGGRAGAILALQDITPLKRTERMRGDFVANVSHELRTPLSSLIGFIETIRGPARDDPEARERFLAIMQDQAARMSRLVTDLLSLAGIEQREHTQPNGAVDIASVLAGVTASLEFKAQARRMRICLEAPDHLPPVAGDRDELVQLLQNLLDNAVKYGREGSEVRISVEAPADAAGDGRAIPMVAVAVRDEGEGIAREHLPRLTERFYRIDAARSRSMGGTGLGLAIVKHIVNRHRGRLSIDSEVGQGSTFTVQLPIVPGRAPAAIVTEPS